MRCYALMVTISGARGFDHRGEKALVDFVNSLAPAPCGALLSWWRPVDYTQLKKAAVITSCERIVEAGGAGGGFIADPSTPCVADGSTEAAVVGNNTCVTASPLSPSFCGAPDAPCAIAANCYWERVAPKGSEDARQRVYTDEDAADAAVFLQNYAYGFALYTAPAIACFVLGLCAALTACCCVDGGCNCIPRVAALCRRPCARRRSTSDVGGKATKCAPAARCKVWRLEWGYPLLVGCSSCLIFVIVIVAFAFAIAVAVHVGEVATDAERSLGDFVTFSSGLVVPIEKLAYTDLPAAQSELGAALNVSGLLAGLTESIVTSFDGLGAVLESAVLPARCDAAGLPECAAGDGLVPGTGCCYTCAAAAGCAAIADEVAGASAAMEANVAPISDALATLRVTLVDSLATASDALLPLLTSGSATLTDIASSVADVKTTMSMYTDECVSSSFVRSCLSVLPHILSVPCGSGSQTSAAPLHTLTALACTRHCHSPWPQVRLLRSAGRRAHRPRRLPPRILHRRLRPVRCLLLGDNVQALRSRNALARARRGGRRVRFRHEQRRRRGRVLRWGARTPRDERGRRDGEEQPARRWKRCSSCGARRTW